MFSPRGPTPTQDPRRARLLGRPAKRLIKEPATLPARGMVLGCPATVCAGLEAVPAEYGAHEVIVVTVTHSHAARERSYELLAEAFGSARSGPQRPLLLGHTDFDTMVFNASDIELTRRRGRPHRAESACALFL